MAQTEDQFKLRLPEGMRERIKADAAAAGRSMTAEIVHRVESSVGLRDLFAAHALAGLTADAEGQARIHKETADLPRLLAWKAYALADAMMEARK